jgi:uncharacterized membrane protein YeaQ/YmgE (transglycosylase-associated protein family)
MRFHRIFTAGHCERLQYKYSVFVKLRTMNLLAWIVLGLIAGAIAKAIDPAARGSGVLGTLLLGIIGAFVGGTLATLLTTGQLALTTATLSLPGIAIAVVGAIIAVFVWHRFAGRTV